MKQYARNDAALAKLFENDPNLDRNLIGFVRKQVQIP